MELIIILVICVVVFIIAMNAKNKKHVDMENNVVPKNEEVENNQFKYENRLYNLSRIILFLNILGSIILIIEGINERLDYNISIGEAWMYVGIAFAIILVSYLLHTFFAVIKEISVNIKKLNK